MKSRVLEMPTGGWIWIAAAALFAGMAMPRPITAQQQAKATRDRPHYAVTDLGTLGGEYSYAYGLNNNGQVAGGAATRGQTGGVSETAFLWKNGKMTNLGTLEGFNSDLNSEAGGPNSKGDSAILSETSRPDPNGEDFCAFGTHLQCLAAVWSKGAMTALPTLGGNNSQAYWINNRGEVAGFIETRVEEAKGSCATASQLFDVEAVIWHPDGKTQVLRPIPDDTFGYAWGINQRGQAVGASGSCANTSLPPANPSGRHAVLWERDGSPRDLGGLGHTNNVATSINDRGQVVGTSQVADGSLHPFLWTREEGIRDLGTLPGSFVTVAPCCHSINNRGEVVGFSIDGNGERALLWENKGIVDLNNLIAGNTPWYLLSAESINEAGQIAGYGLIGGDVHAFLATPCSERDDDAQCGRDDRRDSAESAAVNNRPHAVLTESARKFLQIQRRGRYNPVKTP